MPNQLFDDIAEIKESAAATREDLKWLRAAFDQHLTSHLRWTISLTSCLIAAAVTVLIALIG